MVSATLMATWLLDIPPMEQPLVGKGSHEEIPMMQDWAKTYGPREV